MTYFIIVFHHPIYYADLSSMKSEISKRWFKHKAYTRIKPLEYYILKFTFKIRCRFTHGNTESKGKWLPFKENGDW